MVRIYWPTEFGDWLARVRATAADGDEYATVLLQYTAAALELLNDLPEPPTEETADLKQVRQSRRHQVWRISHPYHEGVAMRLICWFPPDSKTAVVTVYAGDKARIGDIWYSSVANRADALIDQWKREVRYDREA